LYPPLTNSLSPFPLFSPLCIPSLCSSLSPIIFLFLQIKFQSICFLILEILVNYYYVTCILINYFCDVTLRW
jgi:hypothetical protein